MAEERVKGEEQVEEGVTVEKRVKAEEHVTVEERMKAEERVTDSDRYKDIKTEQKDYLQRFAAEGMNLNPEKFKLIEDLLMRLNLEGRYKNKLNTGCFNEITQSSIQNENPKNEMDLVHTFMQRLLTIDYRARYLSIKAVQPHQKSQQKDGKVAFSAFCKKTTGNKESKLVQVHPMDVLMAVFLCADPFLQQNMVTKLAQCQYAVPLLVPNPFSNSRNTEFPLWTLRQISKSWKTMDTSKNVISKTLPMCKAQTPMVAFFRIGSISSSKSQLINKLINEKHDTFFHRDCPGSSSERLLMDGVVEMAWYLPSGKSTDHFSHCVTFCNLRGDSSVNETQRKILTEMASVNIVLLRIIDENDNNMVIVRDLYQSSTPLIVVLTDEEDGSEDGVCEIEERKYKVTLKGRNQSNISISLRQAIENCLLQTPVTFSLEKMEKYKEIKLDENSEACQRGKEAAEGIMRLLQSEDPSQVKGKYLPCQGKLWHDWCQINKDLRRLKSDDIEKEKSDKEEEMREIRRKQQKCSFSELMGLFVGSLRSLSDSEKMYFLKWMAILLDAFTSDKLSDILKEYDRKWSEVLALKQQHDKERSQNLHLKPVNTDKLKSEQSELEKISIKLNAATFGLEHMLREMGQIYEASVSERRGMESKENGDLSYLPELAAELMISGHPMELMDGDAAHVPLSWVSAVLHEVIRKLGDHRVFVLSVLGIQSSGKSTMLNAMFGLQFAVSAGRCTRGAFMQLVKVSEEMKAKLKFDYILVIDTEGLRALEMAGTSTIHHDNELATFVVGLGNMTLINIFGENPTEMQDILQIVVQAFMRMKKVRLNPSCIFVHQNVTDITAGDKIMEGRRRLQDRLDEMTKLAAKDEVYDAECFSEVIKFNIQNDVKYFSQLWEGSPPMAPPNPSYSENVQELKRDIVSRASKTNCMTLCQFRQRVTDLWEALLNENFVFSFRNTLEISVYRKLEVECEKWTWSLRSNMLSIEDTMLNRIKSGKVETVERQELMIEMSKTLQKVQRDFKVYFEESSEKETLIQWKNRFETKIQNLHDDLINESKRKLDEHIKQKSIRKDLDSKMKSHEKALFEKSKDLALKLKDNGNRDIDLASEFDSVWGKWVSEITKDVPQIKDINILNDAMDILVEIYEYGLVYDQKYSGKYRKIWYANDYQNYVSMKRLKVGGFPIWEKSLKPEDQKSIQTLIYNVIEQTTKKVNSFPISVKGYNARYIQEIAREVKQLVKNFKPNSNTFEFKNEFYVDLSLYVCEQAEKRFSEFHRKYKEANDPLIYFQKKRAEYFKVFENYYKGASAAAVLGDRICSKLKETILQSVYNMIANFIYGQLRGKPPFNGIRGDLEKHILKSLAEQKGDKGKKFQNYLTYMNQPRTHFENFIREKVKQYKKEENYQAITAIQEHIEHKQRIVISVAETIKDYVKEEHNGNVSEWMDTFSDCLVDELGDTRVPLSDDVTDCEVLVDVMKKELSTVVTELKGSLSKLSSLRDEMFRVKPDEILIQHFCKCCWVQCPFCGAVCTNSQEGHDEKHQAEYHRSGGMRGSYYEDTTEFSRDFCTTKVVSDLSFYVENAWYPYKEYWTAGGEYAKWQISSNFTELSYWKWFICEFQQNLETHHEKQFSGMGEIPAEWKSISQQGAVESLHV